MLTLADFDYTLPKSLIAQTPLPDRSASRLLVLSRATGEIFHKKFTDIIDYLSPGDCLVRNNTRVMPSRLFGVKPTGAVVEALLLKRVEKDLWEALVRPGKRLKDGAVIEISKGRLTAVIEAVLPDGNRLVRFFYEGVFENILEELGHMPLPPYITKKLEDKERYQTVYSKIDGSVAAPTAGLHFTEESIDKIRQKGVSLADLTLHVGLGTFRPVKQKDITKHKMHTEHYEITQEAADIIYKTRASGHKVICVGTTCARTLESVYIDHGSMHCGSGETDIFIYPGYDIKSFDGLITNFHLPGSTLLMLVSAFAGREHVMRAYEEAVQCKYRFFSFGDAMLII